MMSRFTCSVKQIIDLSECLPDVLTLKNKLKGSPEREIPFSDELVVTDRNLGKDGLVGLF